MPITQANRELIVSTPLGEDVLLLDRMSGNERLGRLFEFRLELLSEDGDIAHDDLLGKPLTVSLRLADGEWRFFNGFVSSFVYRGGEGELAAYEATVHPWLWFLTRTANCRIFQHKAVPDILMQVFGERGFSDVENRLTRNYREWEYCVQYRETDFDFVSRLMEQEGIYYYFEHEEDKHTLILADDYSAHATVAGYEEVPYFPAQNRGQRLRDHIDHWRIARQIQAGQYVLDEYDFKRSAAELLVQRRAERRHAHAEYEVFDYPGEYVETGDGEQYVNARLEELQSRHGVVSGEGDARGLAVGSLFTLTGHPREQENTEHLITTIDYALDNVDFGTGETSAEEVFSCRFTAFPTGEPHWFRAQRSTPRPVVHGPQTAVVVGPSGEEIWPDEFGRVVVQFHWDREGASDANSSCWVRVAQNWAGNKWGSQFLPRIGQEVMVEFLEGDPDHPIITGRVYNDANMPPYALPAEKNLSGLKSNSTTGGGGYNEYVFDDSKGKELIREHAQFDKDSTIENDLREHVLNNRSRDVGADETIQVGNDQTYSIGKNQDGTVGANKTITVGASHIESIGASMSVSVGSSLTETVAVNYAETVGAAMELTVGGAMALTVGAVFAETVGSTKTEAIGSDRSERVGKNSTERVGRNKSVNVGQDFTTKVDGQKKLDVTKEYLVSAKKIQIQAEDELKIKVGKAEIVMTKAGDISIKGKKLNLKASGDIVIKGSKVKEN